MHTAPTRSPSYTQALRRAAAKLLTAKPAQRLDSTAPYLSTKEFKTLFQMVGDPISYRRLRQILGLPICNLPPSIRRVFHPHQTDPWYVVIAATHQSKMPRQYCIPLATLAPLYQQVATTHHLASSLEQRLPAVTVALYHRLAVTPHLSYATYVRTTASEHLVTRRRFNRIQQYFRHSQRTFRWDPAPRQGAAFLTTQS